MLRSHSGSALINIFGEKMRNLKLSIALLSGLLLAFSSIAFCGSLPWNNGDPRKNNISRLVKNVLDRFAKDGPLPDAPRSAIKHRGRADYDPPMNKKRK